MDRSPGVAPRRWHRSCGCRTQVPPAPRRHALGVELDVLAHHRLLPSRGPALLRRTDRFAGTVRQRVQGVYLTVWWPKICCGLRIAAMQLGPTILALRPL